MSDRLRAILRFGIASFILAIASGILFSPNDTMAQGPSFVANYDESKVPSFKLPDLLVNEDGTAVSGPQQWENRRAEILELFKTHVFGRMPDQRRIEAKIVRRDASINGGKTVRYEMDVTILPLEIDAPVKSGSESGLTIAVLIDVPTAASPESPVPAFLGLNFKGNHSVTDDPNVRLPESWVKDERGPESDGNKATQAGRSIASKRWPSAIINSRGYAMITAYYGDIDPDFDDGFKNGVHGLFAAWIEQLPPDQRPGSIAGWTYGLQAILDAIVATPELGIDADRVAVIGHSRLGKTSLWAGAVDPRFALVVSNDSGCGGAALSRRVFGETVGRINRSFPHWFCDGFNAYNENENALPVDSHQLIALTAPRPIAIGSAQGDQWADPRGEFLSAKYASPVWELLGRPGLRSEESTGEAGLDVATENPPGGGEAYQAGTISYHLRPGEHDLTEHDWNRYMDFADQFLKSDDTEE